MDRLKSAWGTTALIVGLFLLVQLVGGVVIAVAGNEHFSVAMFGINAALVVLALALHVTQISELTKLHTTALKSLFAFVGLILLCCAGDLCNEYFDLPDIAKDVLEQIMQEPLGMLAIGLVGPLAEECFFRAGIMGHLMRRGVSARTAIFVSAALFGLIHANPAQIPFAFAIGLAFGYVYLRTRSIVVTTLAHVVNNSSVVVLSHVMGIEKASEFSLIDWLGGNVVATCVAVLLIVVGVLLLKQLPAFANKEDDVLANVVR